MKRIISLVGLALFIVGVWQGLVTYSFVNRAKIYDARVTGIQELRGPPKPRQRTTVNILYLDPSGREVSAITRLPLLQEIKQGDRIRVLIDSGEPSIALLPLWSELWAKPITYVIGGFLIFMGGVVVTGRRRSS